MVLGVISAIANGFVPLITGRFFDALINVSQQKTTVFGSLPLWGLLLSIWAIIQLVANNVDWIMDRLRRKIDTRVQFNIQTEGFIHFFKLPLSFHKNTHISGDLQKLSTAGWRVSSLIQVIADFAPQFLSILIGITLAASINFLLAEILLVGVLLYLLLLIRILLPVAKIDWAVHRAWNEGWDDSAAAVLQIESVKQAAAEEYESKKASRALLGKAWSLWYKLQIIWSNVSFFQRLIVFATQLTVFIFSVQFVANGVITVGELVALNGYALMFFGPFVMLGYSWQIIQNGISSAAQANEIFRQPIENYAPAGAASLAPLRGEVKFEKVCFSYGHNQPQVLDDISFSIQPGQIIAFVGESGVGKSTAISLISGYNFPTAGQILIDGIDTRKFNLTNLRQQIAVVPQEVALFNDTIKANIRYGSFGASDEQVFQAAREAHIEEFVNTLPKKYETTVGERGIKLSVGQKQRVSIARAILRQPAILILDEPTSALDAKTEKIVTEALEKLMTGRTTFIIAHRLSTVRKANTILVFDKGKIVEQGTHQELIAKEGGVYRHLYEYQIGLH
ncbi:MAG: ATP-binding cassette, subfamily B, bacterial MsbA [Parcubacteria group bacterium Gr01-1014_73]|nr:MAG: ATP-binding cassette, subfamily B, bacterial MsbA [Parcubacteria group bacterium Gr01-1014_73]